MTIAIWILSLLLIAGFVMAPINLWTGRTMPLFTRFTGFPPTVATRVFAPAKLARAALGATGLPLSAAGSPRPPAGTRGPYRHAGRVIHLLAEMEPEQGLGMDGGGRNEPGGVS